MWRYSLRLENAPALGQAISNIQQGRIAVIDEADSKAGQFLVAALQARNCNAGLYQQVPADCSIVISLLAWRKFTDHESALQSNYQNFALAKQIAPYFNEQQGSFILVQDTGLFGLENPDEIQSWSAGGSGLIKTAGLEWPESTVKVIDVGYSKNNLFCPLGWIVAELFNGGPEIEIAYNNKGQRLTLHAVADKNSGTAQPCLNKDSVLLVSGGGRGITAGCLREIAQNYQPRIAILGRSALQTESSISHGATTENELKTLLINNAKQNGEKLNLLQIQQQARAILAQRDINQTITDLNQAGAEVMYLVADVQNAAEIAQAINSIHQRWGNITGLIHGAGVLADKRIIDKTETQFSNVFNTKVRGLETLLNALAQEPLQLIALFSSIVGRRGNEGQADYAMANEVLNKVAQAQQMLRGNSCLVKAINWGLWEGGMVSPELIDHFRQRNIPTLPLETGRKLFLQEITHHSAGQTEVIMGAGELIPEKPKLIVRSKEGWQRLMSFEVQQNSHHFLFDHSIKNVVVVPLCMVLDWFMRAAQNFYPLRSIRICENLRVLKSLRLEHFQQGQIFHVYSQETEQGLKLKLCCNENQVYYTATIPSHIDLPEFQPLSVPSGKEWPWTIHEVYHTNIAFHGPSFQVLQSCRDFSPQGGSCKVTGIAAMSQTDPSWMIEPWLIDVAALDGGLQMCGLWSLASGIGLTLPMCIKRFILYQPGLIQEPIEVYSKPSFVGQFNCEGTVQFRNAKGQPIATMEGLEGVFMPK